jgi:D-inositol-3-phosphate glycosyltransferase
VKNKPAAVSRDDQVADAARVAYLRDPLTVWLVGYRLFGLSAGVERCIRGWAPGLAQRGIRVAVGTVGEAPPPVVDGVPWFSVTDVLLAAAAGPVFGNSWFQRTSGAAGGYVHHSVPRVDATTARYASSVAGLGVQVAVSEFVRRAVSTRLGLPCFQVPLFAHPAFASTPTVTPDTDVVVASRLTAAKGAMAAIGVAEAMPETSFTFLTGGADLVCLNALAVLRARFPHRIRVQGPVADPRELARLIGGHRALLMPTPVATEEAFGLLSVEAQHAGVPVVATGSGGLPETDCGLLTVASSDDVGGLCETLDMTLSRGPATAGQRETATTRYTLRESVDVMTGHVLAAGAQVHRPPTSRA